MDFTRPASFRRFAVWLVAAGATAVMSTAARADDGNHRVSFFGSGSQITGSGKLANESRAVTGFQAIALRASMKVVLRQARGKASNCAPTTICCR